METVYKGWWPHPPPAGTDPRDLCPSGSTATGQEFHNQARGLVNVGWRQPPKNSLMAPVDKSPEGQKSLSPDPAGLLLS